MYFTFNKFANIILSGDDNMNQEKIGKLIGEIRKEKNMKQSDLAELLGVTSKTVSRWETGKYMPDLSLFVDISEILGITLNELIQGERIIGKKNKDSIEIEMKLEIEKNKYNELLTFFKTENVKHVKKKQHDIYFSPENPKFFGGEIDDECIRIRVEKNKYILCYKKIYFGNDESDIHITEYETEVSNLEATINILKGIRINKICDLIKQRDSFIYKNMFEISLDLVEDLGYFIEIEIYDKELPIREANKLLLKFIQELNLDITKRNLKGYSYLMYDRINNN